MKIVDPLYARHGGESEHRPGGISFTYLLEGEEFQPDNFSLMLVHIADRYSAPRHRHNFEQVRVILDGSFGFGPGRSQLAGSIGYFSEGVYYTQDGRGPSTTLLLQVAGASGHGYMSEAQMRAGVRAVQARGEFRDGVFTWLDANGKRRHQDGYEAVWEHVFGRPIVYPQARYDAPIILEPDRFAWIESRDEPGVATKRLGSFNERELALSAWRLAPGATATWAGEGRRGLGYVMRGDARAGASGALAAGFAFELAAADSEEIRAGDDGLEVLRFMLPAF